MAGRAICRTGCVGVVAAIVAALFVAPATASEGAAPPTVEPAGAEPPAHEEDATSAHLRTVAWVGLGVGIAGWVTWGVTGAISLGQAASLADDCPDDVCPADRQDDLDTAKTLSDVATVGFVVGLTGTLYGVIALLVTPGDDSGDAPEQGGQAGVSVRPQIGPGYLGVSGQF